MATENSTPDITPEENKVFKLKLLEALENYESIHVIFDEDRMEVMYLVFLDGLIYLVEWIKGHPATAAELAGIMNAADKISTPIYFMDPHWGRQFTEENILALAVAIKNSTLPTL